MSKLEEDNNCICVRFNFMLSKQRCKLFREYIPHFNMSDIYMRRIGNIEGLKDDI